MSRILLLAWPSWIPETCGYLRTEVQHFFFSLWVDMKFQLGTLNLLLTIKLTDFPIDRMTNVVREIFISVPCSNNHLDIDVASPWLPLAFCLRFPRVSLALPTMGINPTKIRSDAEQQANHRLQVRDSGNEARCRAAVLMASRSIREAASPASWASAMACVLSPCSILEPSNRGGCI
jgi:hypothetical protein